MKTFHFHSDPAHGWLQVSAADLADVGLTDKDFSPYSYTDGTFFYLEEDCDASRFVNAYQAKHGKIRTIDEYTAGASPIRSMKSMERRDEKRQKILACIASRGWFSGEIYLDTVQQLQAEGLIKMNSRFDAVGNRKTVWVAA